MEKLKVNSDICIGCGLCVSQNEEYFEFNEMFAMIMQRYNKVSLPQNFI